MKSKAKICINCIYFEYHRGTDYCNSWGLRISPLVRTTGCAHYEPNLHDNNAARQNPEARDKGIHQEE